MLGEPLSFVGTAPAQVAGFVARWSDGRRPYPDAARYIPHADAVTGETLRPMTEPDRCPLLHSGKVRELYAVDDRHLLMVASDRISAFDVVFDRADPGQGPGADGA